MHTYLHLSGRQRRNRTWDHILPRKHQMELTYSTETIMPAHSSLDLQPSFGLSEIASRFQKYQPPTANGMLGTAVY